MWSTTLNSVLKWLRPIVGLLAVLLSISSGQGQAIRPAERQALIDLYNSTNGPGWNRKANWLTDSSPCGWDGVTCKNGSITRLNMPYNNLTGTLPTSLSALTYLENLDLYDNQLSGEIPASLGTLTNLERLDLNNNQLSGSIPSSLSALTRLTQLSLHDNQLSGCLPASLSALCDPTVTVNLSNNPGLPSGGDFTTFCVSGLGSDAFQPVALIQPNPASLGQSVSLSVTEGNAYRWSGPEGFTASVQSPTLSLSSVTQSGLYSVNVTDRSAGCEATASVSLTVNAPGADYQALVDLYNSTNGPNWPTKTNWLTGSSPCGWYGVSCTNGQIVGLKLDQNNLIGTIPASLSLLTSLGSLDLSRNQLSGPIPASLGALTNLGQLILNNNQLSGSIPSSLSALLHLELLNLNENQLSGCLPAGLSVFCGKEILLFRNPGLPGGGNFRAFCQSGLGSDQPIAIVQPNPASLGESVSLSVTAGTAYRWCGPQGFTASVQSPTLSLSSVSQGGLYSVTVTNGSSTCEATASVSLTVNTRADVQALIDLYTSTDGPNWANNTNWLKDGNTCGWYGVTCINDQITRLDLDNNQLKGTLPASLSALTQLQHLGLYNNQLSGPILDGISALTQLQWLDLGQNQLGGEIPSSLSALTSLQVLSLARNAQLSGSIPAGLGSLTNLQRLYLNDNQLSGCIPASLSALCGKEVYLSGNPGLPGGGDFAAFCASGLGSDGFQPVALAQPNPARLGQLVSLSVTAGTAYRWSGPESFTASVQSPTLSLTSVSQSGLYSVTVTNGSGSCAATASVSLTVNGSAEYQALLDLYTSTNGPNWTNNTNWLTSSSPCDWYGIECTNGQITGLKLSFNQLSGTLPSSLSALANLQNLTLDNNHLIGEIPSSLGGLTNLQVLTLSYNNLSGSIPASLSTLTQLQQLFLANNQLSGSIPANLGALANLQDLKLSNNQLSGCLPTSLTALCGKFVDLSGNPGLPGGGDFRDFCIQGLGSDAPPQLTASALTTTNQPIAVTASGCAGTLSWNVAGGTGSADGNLYTLTQPGTYTLSASCALNTCQSAPSPPLSLRINPPLPELTPLLYLRPLVVYGITDMTLVVDVVEINGVNSSWPVTLKVSRNRQLVLSFDASQNRVGGRSVDNGSWQFSADDSYYILTSNASVPGGSKLSFGLSGVLNPGSTSGTLTVSAIIAPGSGGEGQANNNEDTDKVEYFQQ